MTKRAQVATLDPANAFRDWLRGTTGLSDRAVRDVVSRARRAQRLQDVRQPSSEAELRFRLETNDEFQSYSASVRSQLKRAATLYRRFLLSVEMDGEERE